MTTLRTVSCFLAVALSFWVPKFSLGAQEDSNKTVLIIGSSQGIGFVTAKKFRERGWKVWGVTRSLTQEHIDSEPGIHFREADITDLKSIELLVEEIVQHDGKIDALINNAAYGLIGALETISVEEAKREFEVNFFSVMRTVSVVVPLMREQEGGSIINISSTSGVRAVPGLGMYAATKFALEGYTEALAVELSPWNINVSLVEPGTVKNNWARHCSMSDNETGVASYDLLSHRLLSKLIDLASEGQECDEIAGLIVQIAESTKPNLRNQTNEQSRKAVSSTLVDPTGNSYREKWTAFMKDLTVEPAKEAEQ